MEKKDIISRNRMTIAEMKAQNNNSKIEYYRKANGRCFFMCGDLVGYVSPKVGENIAAGKVTAEDLQMAECSTDGGKTWVPTIMMNGAELLGTM